METSAVLDIAVQALWVSAKLAAPVLITALVVGFAISVLQSITQIQEVTLTFIPKIIAILVVTLITGSFVGSQIFAFTELVYGRIVTGF